MALRNAIIAPDSLAWSPDGRAMYFADTNRHTIWARDCDPRTGAAPRERAFAVRPGVRGLPEARFAG